MANSGMIQYQRLDGSWENCYPASYKKRKMVIPVSRYLGRPVRLINSKGEVLFTSDDDPDS